MTYVSEINGLLKARVKAADRLVSYGQNIVAGSCLSGLTRGLEAGANGRVLNTPNAENSLVAAGFGLMLQGFNGIYFMKQQDFLLLGLDHLVNTWNVVRRTGVETSFTVMCIVVDCGYHGPQSSLNNFDDFCSFAHAPGYAINNHWDARRIIDEQLVAPGFRIIGVSQRLFGAEMPTTETEPQVSGGGDVYRYAEGGAATIIARNFAFPQALALYHDMAAKGLRASLFSVPAVLPGSWGDIAADAARSGRAVIIDDSKSENRTSDRLMLDLMRQDAGIKIVERRWDFTPAMLTPNPDLLTIDHDAIIRELDIQ